LESGRRQEQIGALGGHVAQKRQSSRIKQGLLFDALQLREATGKCASRELAMAVTPNDNSRVVTVVVEDVVEDNVRGRRLLGSATIAPTTTAVYHGITFAMVIIVNACCFWHVVTNNVTIVELSFLGTELTGAVQGVKRGVHRGLHKTVVCFCAVLCFRKGTTLC
jgi:hypothetical protein